jgi:hypothetical protein
MLAASSQREGENRGGENFETHRCSGKSKSGALVAAFAAPREPDEDLGQSTG